MGFSSKRHELDLIACSSLMNVHYRADVTSLQASIGQILREHHAIVFLNHDSAG
jgi:hypothetical protein